MTLKYGIPPGNPTVVWDDIEGVPGSATNDPYVSWQYHLDRTNQARGGVDMTARWAPLYAPVDCRVEHYGGGAGTAVRMWAADNSGWSDVFDHMSTIDVPNNAIVPFGGRVGTSGDTGAVGAPHLHWHRLDPSGARRIPWDYFTDGTTTPTPNTNGEENMRIIRHPNGSIAVIGTYYSGEYGGADTVGISANVKAWGPVIAVDAGEYARLLADATSRRNALVGQIAAATP